ncbi:uncharacterized protein LOC129565569 [Sitodiplosis mosellana]|uniref:uncharacterized protein LOC129565569 n=1 Tax=Sitodiplosis mosellana TaxID=263140 RepID=UPI002444E02F|nr:uncharacterized protein LOC129565569 [Sitodiplosis mosellana]XP_055296555.1 uncharacterized protein LOC129565569 [Sitodiplosis mosellana]XP_055296556.1 uncharacterized protein LOC129565569 [Sitodiplosis mosellana]XP_055296558.1 uncharacterized protein LOC129565569 [Sitodiplosis mosellana]
MKRQKLKVFNSCHHRSTMNCASENKLFTVLFNRRAMLGIALLLSTLLPLNHAAPTAKSLSHSNDGQTETTSTPPPPTPSPPSTTVSPAPPTTITTTSKVTLNGTIQMDKINDKVVLPPVDSALDATAAAASVVATTIEKTPSNDKASSIEYNKNGATIKSVDSVRVTIPASASSSNNYLDKNNRSVPLISISISESQTQPTAAVDKNIDVASTSLSTTEPLVVGESEDLVTTTTFIPHPHSSTETILSDVQLQRNKNPTQETVFTTENVVQTATAKSSSISGDLMVATPKSSSDNIATPTTPKISSLTEIDELSFRVNAEEHFNGPANMQSEANQPLSTGESVQTNGNDRDRDDVAVTNENSKPFDAAVDGKLGHAETTQTTILIKSASTTASSSESNGSVGVVGRIATDKTNNGNGGKITKVFDEEKSSSSKKAKHESNSNNNKKYNNKNNKDKSKTKANEYEDIDDASATAEKEGGVNDPNGKLNDNLLRESVSFVQEPTTSAPSFATDVRSAAAAAAAQTTTIRSMESHSIIGESLPDDIARNSPIFDEIRTEPVINADVTSFTPTSIFSVDAHISSTLNAQDPSSTVASPTTTTTTTETPTKTEVKSSTEQKHHDTVGQKITSTTFTPELATKEPANDTTLPNEKQLATEKVATATETAAATKVTANNDSNKHSNAHGNEMNKADNEFMRNDGMKSNPKPTTGPPSILDYDKSSEEIFDIVRETSTPKADITSTVVPEKRPHDANNDEFFLPADDLETDTMVTVSTSTTSAAAIAAVVTTSATTTIQSTVPINTESAIVRPNTDSSGPTITAPIPIVTSDSKQQTTDVNKASTISRDSDTIFYISNTEVKVVESSVPTPNSKQENQFFRPDFPALFQEDVIIDFPFKNSSGWNPGLDGPNDKYEEDIILSPMKSNFDPTKLNDENLSISYVGESFIDIKEATSDDTSAGNDANSQNNDISSESKENGRSYGDNAISSNVIIEPVVIPDLQQSIGVPIIGELPSQINIRDLDYKNDAIQLNNSGNSISSHFPTHPGDNLQKAQELTAELPKTDSEEAIALIDDEDKVDITKNETQKTNTTTAAEAITNVTAFGILDDDPETNWNDIQTIIIIALLTIVPTIGCLVLVFAIRKVYRKAISLHDDRNSSGTNGNVLLRDGSTDPLAMNPHTISADELKSVDCEANGINHSNDNLISNAEITSMQCDEMATGGGGGQQMNHHSGANGSLITMTMKNNHLIVETEERSDIARDVRETKVHYSPSEKDGVFVVEVARGADSNTTPIMMANVAAASKAGASAVATAAASMTVEQMTISPRQTQATIVEVPEEQPKSVDYASSNDVSSCTRSNEKVLVHPPPNGMCLEDDVLMIDEDGAVSMSSPKHNGHNEIVAHAGSINTGLSQSDLSISSSDGSNRAYCYGTQETYTVDTKSYQSTSPHHNTVLIEANETNEPNAPTPEPITVISDTEHENQINENGSLENTLDNTVRDATEPLLIDIVNENQIPTTNNGIILSKALKTATTIAAEIEIENGNEPQQQQQQLPSLHEHEHHHKNGFSKTTESIITTNGNGKLNGDLENGFNGNEQHLTDNSNDFDSLMNFPAPPTCDEIKQFNEITQLDNGNMDSLPPPPPEILPAAAVATVGPINVES